MSSDFLTALVSVPVSDSFSFLGGYGKRFGLFFVDYETQKRTAKPAVAWYKNLISDRIIVTAGPSGASEVSD